MTPNSDETRKPDEASASPEAAPEAPETSPAEETESPVETTADSAEEAPAESADESAAASPKAELEPKPDTKPDQDAEPAAAETGEQTVPTEEPSAPKDAEPAPVAEMAEAPEGESAPAAASTESEAAVESTGDGDVKEEVTDPKVAEALTKAAAGVGPTLRPGKRLKVTLVQIGEKDSFVDYGGRSEGNIATSELKDDKEELKYNIGDEIGVVVRKGGDSPIFTLGKRRVPANLGKVKEAFENQVPMEGKIKSTNKGGFEVDLHGVRAFCPYSQIQLGYCDKPEEYVGQKLPMMVITFERGGRNIVVSRRKLIEEEGKAAAGETMEKLDMGAVFDGTVRRLQPYGAFIDIGGMDGLVHVSEISHGRVTNPSDVLKVGEQVKVKVIRLEGEGDKRRISLSMKDLADDPWAEVPKKFQEGATVQGKVVRLAEFGAFIELETGVDGLVHISEISSERIEHPSDKLQRGQDVEVRVLQIDPEQRRISLTMLSEEEAEQARANRPARRPGGGGGGGGRGRRDDGPMHHRSETPVEDKAPKEDITKMPFEDALQALKNKFKGD